jgi:ribonuclease E
MEEESIKDNTGQIEAQLPVNVATYLLNEKRNSVLSVEKRHSVQLVIIPNPNMETPHYTISRRRPDDALQDLSYKVPLVEMQETQADKPASSMPAKEQPALQSLIAPTKKTTPVATAKAESVFAKVGKWLGALVKSEPKAVVPEKKTRSTSQNQQTRRKQNPRQDRNDRSDRNANRKGGNVDRNKKNEQTSTRSEQTTNRNERKPRREDNRKSKVDDNRNKDVVPQKNTAPVAVPEKKKEQVAERRKRRDTRRSVRVDNEPSEAKVASIAAEQVAVASPEVISNPESQTTTQNPVVAVDVNSTTAAVEQFEETKVVQPDTATEKATEESVAESASSKEESSERARNRRSPRHIRAAGQKRKKDQEEQPASDAVEIKQDELQFDEPAEVVTAKANDESADNIDKEAIEAPAAEPKKRGRRPAAKSKKPQDTAIDAADSVEKPAAVETKAPAKDKDPVKKTASVEATTVAESSKPVIVEDKPEKPDVEAKVSADTAAKKPAKAETKAKSTSRQSFSAPMAKPVSIDETFAELKIGSLSNDARPPIKVSSKTSSGPSTSSNATAPAARPGASS